MNREEILAEYVRRHREKLVGLAVGLEALIKDRLKGVARVDRVAARAKDPESFADKATKVDDNGRPKYADPFSQIQDQVAARITVFYLPDVKAAEDQIRKYINHIEVATLVPDSPRKFGYEGRHLVMAVPEALIEDPEDTEVPTFFELQIKTLFQHAWSEAEHDLAYKPSVPLTELQDRQIAFTAAQAWGADHMFEKLFGELGGKK